MYAQIIPKKRGFWQVALRTMGDSTSTEVYTLRTDIAAQNSNPRMCFNVEFKYVDSKAATSMAMVVHRPLKK
jgi:hypothetical protein